jgi:predicted ATPase
MIRRIRIDGYKSLRGVELALRPLTLIIGPNAGGKSNLFDALGLLSRMATRPSLADAFREHRGDPLEAFYYGEEGLAGLLRRDHVEFTMEVDVELSDTAIRRAEQLMDIYRGGNGELRPAKSSRRITERLLRYRLTVAIHPKTGVLRVQDESLRALTEVGGELRPDERRRPFLERIGNRLRLRMEGQARPMEYEIGLNHTIVSLPVYPPHYPHLVAFREELASWQFYYFEPRQMREESPVKEVEVLTPSGGDLAAFYYTLQRRDPLQFDNLQRVLRALVPSVEGFSTELTDEGKVRLKIREGGVDFSARLISEGTLRLLGLIAILSPSNPAAVIGLEEPENGVHPRRLKIIADLLREASRRRQVLINTHSPLLPDYLGDEALLVRCVRRDGSSSFKELTEAVGLFRRPAVGEALEEEEPSISQRILRGDWG